MASSRDMPPLTTPYFPNLFLKSQLFTKPRVPPPLDLSGQTAIVTGANTGIGLECAYQLLANGLSRLILAVRSTSKGDIAALKLQAKNPKATIEVWELNMGSYNSIQAFATRAETQLQRLDFAILNAGLRNFTFKAVPGTGHEECIQINYLSTALLSILLLPVLKTKSRKPGRLTIVNTAMALVAKFPNCRASPLLPSFDNPSSFDPDEQYSVSKLLGHMFMWKLADFVRADDVVVNLVDPGFVKGTDFFRDGSKLTAPFISAFKAATGRKSEIAASTYLDACLVKGKESHGCFVMDWRIQPFAGLLYGDEGRQTMDTLWKETLDEFRSMGVQEILASLRSE